MSKKSTSVQFLIAGFPNQTINYRNLIEQSGFTYIYPTCPLSSGKDSTSQSHPYILSSVSSLTYDLLLLPGGGDFSQHLYNFASYKRKGNDSTAQHTPDYITDLLQFQLLQLAYLQKKPILGICKGMQMINVFFGGTLYAHLPTATLHMQTASNSKTEKKRCNSGKKEDRIHSVSFPNDFPVHYKLFGRSSAAEELYQILSHYPYVNSAHHQGIHHLGKGLITVQHSEDFVPETIAHKTLPILGFQWHPERLEDFLSTDFHSLINLLI